MGSRLFLLLSKSKYYHLFNHRCVLARFHISDTRMLPGESLCFNYKATRTCSSLHTNNFYNRKESHILPKHQEFTVLRNVFTSQNDTVEKRLIKFMDMWEMEKAVELMRESILEGNIPNNTVVLNLLQQLANLGETEGLLDLHDFLRERNLVTDTKFFKCLQEAYYNSGRVDEGVAVLRILYHRTRKYRDVEPFFCLLAVMVMRNFPDRIDLIEGFVTDLKEFEVAVVEPMASLWKCYLLTENFSQAEKYLSENEEVQPFVPQMVNDICAKINKIDANYDKVLEHLLEASFIKKKQRRLVYEVHAETLCESNQYEAAIESLCNARQRDVQLNPTRVRQILTKIQQNIHHNNLDEDIEHLLLWCQELEDL